MDEKNCMLPLSPLIPSLRTSAVQRWELRRAQYISSHPDISLLYYRGNDCIIKWDIEHPMARRIFPFICQSFCPVVLWIFSIFLSQDAMVVILKSLVPGCLFNIVGFGSTFKSLFTTSQNYEEVKQFCNAQCSVCVSTRHCSLSSLLFILILGGPGPGLWVCKEDQSWHGGDQHPGTPQLDPEAADVQWTPPTALPAHRRGRQQHGQSYPAGPQPRTLRQVKFQFKVVMPVSSL